MTAVNLRPLAFALSSRRTFAVTLLSFSSGLPLGLVWVAVPDWMQQAGFDIRVIGLVTLTHAPWTFKIWAPLMDRYPLPFLGRRRGWILATQLALTVLTASLAGLGHHPDGPWVLLALCLAIAIASASQDIVYDAYTVDVLRPEEQGVAVGARMGLYRGAMFVAGGLAITASSWVSWPAVNAGLAALYLPLVLVTVRAPEPEVTSAGPRTLRAAIWEPFLELMARHRAVEILAFVMLYKLADNLAQSLQRPFLEQMGYDALDRGLALATVGWIMTVGGAFLGGAVTTVIGLGHSLWLFGVLQLASNLGYVLLANSDVDRPLMYAALGFETLTSGMAMGAFGVLLLRLTRKRFSATQYALLSSLFGLPRLLGGPITGVVVDAVGWSTFYVLTLAAGIPGLVMLARFVPLGVREPTFEAAPPAVGPPPSRATVLRAGITTFVVVAAVLLAGSAALAVAKAHRAGESLPYAAALASRLVPVDASAALELAGTALISLIAGLLATAHRRASR